jgi:hypothetical protein
VKKIAGISVASARFRVSELQGLFNLGFCHRGSVLLPSAALVAYTLVSDQNQAQRGTMALAV